MLKPGTSVTLRIDSIQSDHAILEGGYRLPKNELPKFKKTGDTLPVFPYHNSKNELVITTTMPKAQVGDLATLKVVDMTKAGAFLDWGLPKDLFLPRSYHEDDLTLGDYCLVKLFLDEVSGKVICKETLEGELSNEVLTVKEKEVVNLIVYKDSPIGFQVIVNGKHIGLLHNNEVFRDLYVGDTLTGFVKKIKEGNKLDIVTGKPGHSRVEDVSEQLLEKLKASSGFLPFHDKTPADEIYKHFGISKKTFKMTIGNLYRSKKIEIKPDGISLLP